MSFTADQYPHSNSAVPPESFDWEGSLRDFDTQLGVGITTEGVEVQFGANMTAVPLAAVAMRNTVGKV
jgi:hypothetical protein